MKKRPLLMNMARGPIVNTDDLVRALKEDLLRGAVLDVTDPEPIGVEIIRYVLLKIVSLCPISALQPSSAETPWLRSPQKT